MSRKPRTANIKVRMTEQEKHFLEKLAEKKDLRLSELIRKILENYKERVVKNGDDHGCP